MHYFLTKISKWLAYSVAIFIIIAATLVSIGRMLTPYLNEHRSDFERLASQLFNKPVRINNVNVTWRIYTPQLTFDQVTLRDQNTQKPIFEIGKIKVSLKVISSLLQRQPIPSYVEISDVNLKVNIDSKQLQVAGLGDFSLDQSNATQNANYNLLGWILSQPALVLDDIHIVLTKAGITRSISLNEISLKNIKDKHILQGELTLNQEIATRVEFALRVRGNSLDLNKISANTYFYIEGVSIPQWLEKYTWHHLQIPKGVGSAKIWADYKRGSFKKIQTQFQLYDLQLYSTLTKKSQWFSRLSGHLGWKRQGDKQIISGNELLIDFPEHLWPTTNFQIVLPFDLSQLQITDSSASGDFSKINLAGLQGASAEINYLDFADIIALLDKSGMLSETTYKFLHTLKLKGELRNLEFNLQHADNLLNNAVSFDFSKLSFQSWNNYPAIKNLQGKFDWVSSNGTVDINSADTTFSIPSLYMQPLKLSEVLASLHIQKAENNWNIKGTDIQLKNPDLNVKAAVTLAIDAEKGSAIDLDGEFNLLQPRKVASYLLPKMLDPDLSQWLKDAFHAGQFNNGKAIVKGKLTDFPFTAGQGQFLVSADAQDLTFQFAPDWPVLENLMGSIVFSGPSMNVNVESAKFLNLSLAKVHAEINDLGSAEQILTIKDIITADLAAGLHFIEYSPLQKSLGTYFNGMNLSGPMKLNLTLNIPLRDPNKTQVVGLLDIINGHLRLSEWGLELPKLNGRVNFTENDLKAPLLTAAIFNEPAKIELATDRSSKIPSLKVLLKSKLSDSMLQMGLKQTPLNNLIQGSTPYEAKLNLTSSAQGSQIILSSNLKGLTVKFPNGFGKQVDELTNTTLMANLKPNQPLQAKLYFGEKLSAAVTLKKSKDHVDFYSGELRLGGPSKANWQSQSGLLISGQVNAFDWQAFQKEFPSLSFDDIKKSTGSSHIPLRSIDIKVNQVAGLPVNFTRGRIQLNKTNNGWFINLNSNEMSGDVQLFTDSQQPIQAKFNYLYLNATPSSEKSFDPKSLPALYFISNELRYGSKSFGRVSFNLIPYTGGVTIKGLRGHSTLYNLVADGDWQLNKTHLRGELKTKKIADLLNYWGSPSSNLVDTGATLDFDLNWSDAPYNPALATMSGDASLQLSSGSIINLDESTNAKMGFGRLLNILSLQSIPKRLTLDFSDLFTKGYNFDSMKGNFDLKNGSAATKDFRIEGSVAQIAINGRIGLSAKDFNLKVTVTPYVTGSIPVVAALAINPLAGVAALAIEKIASGAFSGAAAHSFMVTGTWANPLWKEK